MKKRFVFTILSWLLPLLLLTNCGVNSNIMFKQAKGDAVESDSIPMIPQYEYKISVDDKLSFSLATNDGASIIEQMSNISQSAGTNSSGMEYIVHPNGTVELPVIGNIPVAGLTISACEDTLEQRFSKEYKEPFVQVHITNQRVIVFPGNGSDARVIPLTNNNTTLMEALAQAGGITERGKSSSIKLIRRENGIRKIYTIDLSTIEGLKYVDMIVQANDYIYVEPTPELAKGVVAEIAPIISIISSALIVITVVNNLK